MKKKRIVVLILALIITFLHCQLVFAHSGRTDSNGGHWDRSNNTYHYHNGGNSGGSSSSGGQTGGNSGGGSSSGTIAMTSISLITPGVQIFVGDIIKLDYTITPSNATYKNVTWTSSDEDVAQISDSGELTAISPGTVTITAKTSNGKTDSLQLDVLPIDVENVEINLLSDQYYVGDSVGCEIKISPENATDKSYLLISSNPKIAEITDDGTIKFLDVGEVIITAKAANNIESQINITVILPVKEILANKKLSLIEGENKNISYTIAPEEATIKTVQWISLDESIATVDNEGHVHALKEGETVIKIIAHNGVETEISVSVKKFNPLTLIILIAFALGGYFVYKKRKTKLK